MPLYPILGVGSAPFRGNLTPGRVDRVLKEYPSVQTFTVQSAFKYDYPPCEALSAINRLMEHQRGKAMAVDEVRCIEIVDRCASEFKAQVLDLAEAINKLATFVPKRRKRKLHTGQFGYARKSGEVSLPRAITFTAALYTLGLPPELLALNALLPEDLDFVRSVYVNFDQDIVDALRFYNPYSPYVPRELRRRIANMMGSMDLTEFEFDMVHREHTKYAIQALSGDKTESLPDHIVAAAKLRGFLG
jgi:phosphoenolpyruvate carboxylase